ncbi:MAG: SH3 domain-containing C40 family peptidase [Eubacteriales bacterium]|nr:SH3 domain-containing C40 family peptidase [Eubacteriales bacterium]
MKKTGRILVLSCLLAAFSGVVPAYADAEKSPHTAMLVAAPADYANIAVSQVTGYVNIREQATTSSKVVGKIYNNCAATILETVEGEGGTWYRIQSGTVNGFIKAQYFITGDAAETLAQSIGREFVTVNADNLRLREAPNLTSKTLTLLSQGARYVVQGEDGDFFKVEVDADLTGYIAQSYCKVEVEFDQAVSLAEEQAKLAEEKQRKNDAQVAIAALELAKEEAAGSAGGSVSEIIIEANPVKSDNQKISAPTMASAEKKPAETKQDSSPSGSGSSKGSSTVVAGQTGPGAAAVVSATRTAIVAYAKQFLGNPYVYGGTSLTNGADCSGFTQQIFKNFGITTGRSSRDQAARVKEIPVSEAQPGDVLFYASGDYINHVAIYIGGGEVIHASNPTTGITISPYNYRTPCKAGTFLD